MAVRFPKTAAQWTAGCLDLETESAAALKAIERLGEQRGKLALKAKLGDTDAQGQLEVLCAEEIARQIEADDIAVALVDAKGRLAAAQQAEKAKALNKQADALVAGVKAHDKLRSREVDRRLKLLFKELRRWAISAADLHALVGDQVAVTISRRNNPSQQVAALFHHGLDGYFQIERLGGTRGRRSFADVDKRFRNQILHAAALMRAEADPQSAEPVAPAEPDEPERTEQQDAPLALVVGE